VPVFFFLSPGLSFFFSKFVAERDLLSDVPLQGEGRFFFFLSDRGLVFHLHRSSTTSDASFFAADSPFFHREKQVTPEDTRAEPPPPFDDNRAHRIVTTARFRNSSNRPIPIKRTESASILVVRSVAFFPF